MEQKLTQETTFLVILVAFCEIIRGSDLAGFAAWRAVLRFAPNNKHALGSADAIVSWNFQHIVRLDKMKAYHQVNRREGYGILTIVTPKEVLSDEQSAE